jgi:hemerythrin
MVQFTDDLKTGVKVIDDQHQELINRLNAVLALGAKATAREEIEKTLRFLGAYVFQHFHDEEEIQIKANYPKFQWHRNQHQIFLQIFEKLMGDYQKRGPSAELSNMLNKSIVGWVSRHIQDSVGELARYIQSQDMKL